MEPETLDLVLCKVPGRVLEGQDPAPVGRCCCEEELIVGMESTWNETREENEGQHKPLIRSKVIHKLEDGVEIHFGSAFPLPH